MIVKNYKKIYMEKFVELLSPAGDFNCIKACVQNGANSVYLGSNLFNARASATNFTDDNLKNVIEYCKLRNVKTNLTLNTLLKNDELSDAFNIAQTAYNCGIDAIIVQDLGLAMFLIKNFPDLPIHASTQMTVHNLEGVLTLEKLGFKRVVLSRELSYAEIDYICKNSNVEIETFIHGALCISYSGQCLASSMIGGRSGNRGKCAQPCRLPYTLIEESHNTTCNLVSGYLLSPRDLCALDFIPKLIDSGVTCFKIEGRLKSPEYVATVTRIYRKYIDLYLSGKPYLIDNKDKEDLMQVFNRGGFSTGHLNSTPNTNLVYTKKQNNMGIPLGTVSNYNPNKSYITLKLLDTVSIGDSISIDGETGSYNVSELLVNNKNISSAEQGTIVKLGRMKGNIKLNSGVYKIANKELSLAANESYQNCERKKIPLKCIINLKIGTPVSISISTINSKNSFYNDISFTVSSNMIPELSINNPITKDRIVKQLTKTTNTPYEFVDITVNMNENIHLPKISELNELRRNCIENLENIIREKYCSKNSSKTLLLDSHIVRNIPSSPKFSVLLNILNLDFDYSKIKNVTNIYIPFKYFLLSDYNKIITTIARNFNLYIYLPVIIRKNYTNILKSSIEDILSKFNIKGFVVSNIGNLELLGKYIDTYDVIGNYTLNMFNNLTLNEYKKLKLKKITYSPELNKQDITLFDNSCNCELIVYGKTPIMNINYCLLGKSNHCYNTCNHKCNLKSKFYIKDRLGFAFRIIPDNSQTITTIYNSKTTFIDTSNIPCQNLRIDILDEDIHKINNIVDSILSNKRLEGNDFTNGNFNRNV